MVVATAVQPTLQLLTVCRVHEEEDDDRDCVEVGASEADTETEGFPSLLGSTSLRASTIGFRTSCKFFTVSTASVVPLTIPSLTLLAVSITQVTREKAVLNKFPIRLRLSDIWIATGSGSLRRRLPDLHGSTPLVGIGSLPNKSVALGRALSSPLITPVMSAASGWSIQLCISGKMAAITIDKSEALDWISVPVDKRVVDGLGGSVIPGGSIMP